MKLDARTPPRRFSVGRGAAIEIADCGTLYLDADEQVTLVTESGAEYDVARKDWGFYATPSMNGRLAQFGLRAVLVRNDADRFYLLLVERGQERAFESYLTVERQSIVAWLDSDASCAMAAERLAMPARNCLCGGARFSLVFDYQAPPEGEIALPPGPAYSRRVVRCDACGHFLSLHDLDLDQLYAGDYVGATYGGESGIRRAFDRITALPAALSDNAGRVTRLTQFAGHHFAATPAPHTLLDVGSGLGVFVHAMKQAGWICTALDPDPRSAQHARDHIGVDAIHADYRTADISTRFDTVTFNKVLEHVADPVAFLARATQHVAAGGFIYLELPDGEAAVADGPNREEFFVDHLHVFSAASLAVLAARAGLRVLETQRLREPSGKYTLRAFMTAIPARAS